MVIVIVGNLHPRPRVSEFQGAGASAQVGREGDRSGKIYSIALTLGTEAPSPATGLRDAIPLVIVAVDRKTFSGFDLTNVVPCATLGHLGAAVSKAPFDLTPADTSHGVRARKQ